MMPESISLIERAAALLRDRTDKPIAPAPAPIAGPIPTPRLDDPARVDLTLDPVRLARYGIALPSETRSRAVEEFRLVKRNLMALWSQDGAPAASPNRLIMVTSARPGEGKTFVAVNLALAFAAETDGDAVVIDADTERPMLPEVFGMMPDKGIVDVLAGRADLSEVLLRTSLPKLSVIPSGASGPHVPELFSGRRMSSLLNRLTERRRDRFVIIDTPPCMLSSEAATLAPLVGQILVVVEAHRTQRQEVESTLTVLSSCPNVALLLNKGASANGDYFGSYSYYFADP